jgi:flagellar hook-length control protein FliK
MTQVAQPILALTRAASGDHVLTLSVTPDNLGPVTVRAHMSSTGLRVELFAPNDLGRDALRAIMPDLRRDLAGTGMNTNLQLSPSNQPSTNQTAGGQQNLGQQNAGAGAGLGYNQGEGRADVRDSAAPGTARTETPTTETPQTAPLRSGAHASSIDVMA